MKRSLLLAGLVASLVPVSPAQTLVDNRLRFSTWTSGLNNPTTFTWIGPAEMLLIQKNNGRVIWIKDGTIQGTALDLKVQNDSERGGLGIAADPDFVNNHHVFLYFSTTSAGGDSGSGGNWVDNRVERYDWNGTNLVNQFGPIVAFPMDASQSNGSNHDGGVIRFGPDGKLYGVTGDLNRGRFGGMERVEQNTALTGSASVGGMFRLETDGSVPTDNPFVGEADSSFHLWFSYGLRNSFGLTFDALTGICWYTENGPDKYDEVDRCPKGMNGGWLKIMGPDSRDAKYGENGSNSFDASDLTYLQNAVYVDPEFSYKSCIGITAITFLHSKRFPEDIRDDCIWGDVNTNSLFLADMRASRDSFKLPTGLGDKVADDSTQRDALLFGKSWGGACDLQIGSDGYLYVSSLSNGKVYRIRPVTDLVEPSAFAIRPAMSASGEVENRETSNDLYYRVSYTGLSLNTPPFEVGARFQLNEASPTAITVNVEDHYSVGGVVQRINVWNRTTSAWETLDTALIGTSDVTRSVTLANPAQYVDPATLTVEIRLLATPLPTGTPTPPLGLTAAFDLVRLDVTYP